MYTAEFRADRLYPYGIPVSGAFSPAEDRILAKMHARNALNLPQGVPICLVMSGSMGFGNLPYSRQSFHCV